MFRMHMLAAAYKVQSPLESAQAAVQRWETGGGGGRWKHAGALRRLGCGDLPVGCVGFTRLLAWPACVIIVALDPGLPH